MARLLAPDTLHDAVNRIGDSSAKPAVGDLLVFKRALVNARQQTPGINVVETGTKTAPFLKAHEEFAGVAPPGNPYGWKGQPYYSPFGPAPKRYKSEKWPSNGPENTIAGWQGRTDVPSPLKQVPATSPRQYEFVPRSEAELQKFFLKQEGTRPALLDVARWWFRLDDVENRFGHEPTCKELCDGFVSDLALQPPDLALFEALPAVDAGTPAGNFVGAVADPASYLPASIVPAQPAKKPPAGGAPAAAGGNIHSRIEDIVKFVESRGFSFDPWQVAAYVTAVRTKPFVILAGISGTGKTKLPRLVAEATGAEFELIPVHADWTDGSELIGYERIGGDFVPGRMLQIARKAQENEDKQFFVLLDEMNIARVEYYFADILSHIEERERHGAGFRSKPLVPHVDKWKDICLPSNLCVVGSVNMDETTHGFSRKVLDRSFVIEFSDIDLRNLGDGSAPTAASAWTAADWRQQTLRLADHPDKATPLVDDVIGVLETINDALMHAQLQVGYRVRDEIALFRLNARDCEASFRTMDAVTIDVLDLVVAMKILPRIQGGGAAIQRVLDQLRAWANPTVGPAAAAGSQPRAFPQCQERIELMHSRLRGGFTSYWL